MKKLINKSQNAFVYTIGRVRYSLPIGSTIEVPEEIANIWLKYKGIEVVEEKVVITKENKTQTKKSTKKATK